MQGISSLSSSFLLGNKLRCMLLAHAVESSVMESSVVLQVALNLHMREGGGAAVVVVPLCSQAGEYRKLPCSSSDHIDLMLLSLIAR